MKKFIFLMLCGVVLYSCKTKKNTESSSSIEAQPIDDREAIKDTRFFYKEINGKAKFKALKINNKINIKTESFIPAINGTIYIENNKKIWINLTSFFINIGRGLAEKKEFRGYLKQPEKIAIEENYDNVKELVGLDFLDYDSLEKLLLGKTFIPLDDANYVLTKNLNNYLLKSKEPISFNNSDDDKYNITLQYSEDFELKNVELTNLALTDMILIDFSNRIDFNKLNLPQNVKITLKGTKNIEVLIENTKFEDSEMKTPFKIPENYQKVQLHD